MNYSRIMIVPLALIGCVAPAFAQQAPGTDTSKPFIYDAPPVGDRTPAAPLPNERPGARLYQEPLIVTPLKDRSATEQEFIRSLTLGDSRNVAGDTARNGDVPPQSEPEASR